MTRYVVLLKGVNVGGRNKVPMTDLRTLLVGLGFTAVATLLQSGNAVLTSTIEDPNVVATVIDEAGSARYGFAIRSVVRTADELRAVFELDPLRHIATDGSKLLVLFLSRFPGNNAEPLPIVEGRTQPVVASREVYLWSPDGALDAQQLVTFIERRWRVLATSRNWNTVSRLAAMLEP